jgi:two-component system, NarL family, nitrate/nitrite response regulator NarL
LKLAKGLQNDGKAPMESQLHQPSSWVRGATPRIVSSDRSSLGGAAVSTEAPRLEQPVRVLLVSDLLLERAGLHHILEASGVVLVGEAGTCEEAVRAAATQHPDVVLVDLDLRSDAFQCIEELLSAASPCRVIALSDRTRAADHLVLVERGATGLVLKSEPPEVLIKAIRKVHAGEVWLDRTNTAEVISRMVRHRRTEDVEGAKMATLTRREHEIIALVGEGLKNAKIAQRLFVSEATVRNHLTSILSKLGLSDRFELAVYAFRQGLVRVTGRTKP